jgi:pilus assembly protein CpaD
MSRLLTLAAVSAAALAAAGCATPPTGPLTAENNTGLYSLHQPVVERTDYVFDVNAGPEGVSDAELARLDGWFRSIELRYGDRLSLDGTGGYASEAARQDIARVAAQYGLLLGDDAAPVTAGEVPPGAIRVVASRSHASVAGCPTWSDPGIVASTATSSNYGCAVNSNLAAMVADPQDLVRGQQGSLDSNAATATRAIGSYRSRPATNPQALPQTSTTQGN